MPRPKRQALRLRDFDYTWTGAYFVTTCAVRRERVFGEVVNDRTVLSPIGETVKGCWLETPGHFPGAELDSFVVMPNHVHAIVFFPPRATHASPLHLGSLVGAFKAAASRLAGRSLWQRGYHDRVIRDEAELGALRGYIDENPLRWAVDRENPSNM